MYKRQSRLYDKHIVGTIGDSGGYLAGIKPDTASNDPTVVSLCTKAESLKSLQEDFELFTYAPAVIRTGLSVDPFIEFVARRAVPKKLAGFFVSQRPLFSNIAPQGVDQQSNYTLAMIAKSWSDALFQWMDFIGMVDRNKKIYYQMLKQTIPITDVLLMESSRSLVVDRVPTVDIVTYGLAGNRCCWYFEPMKHPPIDCPKLVKGQPDADAVRIANALFAEAACPLDIGVAHEG